MPSTTDRSEWQRPGGLDLDQDLPRARLIEFELDNADRLRMGVGAWTPRLFEDCTDYLHFDSPFGGARRGVADFDEGNALQPNLFRGKDS